MIQLGVGVRDAKANAQETHIGTAPTLEFWNGTMPATCGDADTGTKIAEGVLPSDWLTAASGNGQVAKNGTWTVTGIAAAGAGTNANYFRVRKSSTVHYQGKIGVSVPLTTNGVTSANGNVLNFASTTGVVVGMKISGAGVHADATVVAVTGTTVTMSHTSTAGVSSAVAITFSYDMPIDNVSIANTQVTTVNSFTLTEGGA